MSCSHIDSINLGPPAASQAVYREDCTQCFDSIDDPTGLDVCLQCFNGGCTSDNSHAALHAAFAQHPLVANIRRTRKIIERNEPPLKMSKLAIAAETEADRYETTITARCLECAVDLDKDSDKLAPVIEGLMKANTFSRQEEVKAWELELTECEHILCLQQEAPKPIKSGDLGHCSACPLDQNLWLCLQCGNLGCGRKQLGGVDGNSHGLEHATSSGHGVAVKLGSITPQGNADVYCYLCDEERIDRSLATHLANWGINLADRQKTEKSLTEMQIEQNLRWDFSMTTSDGQQLTPLFGPGLTGLKNLGNSCYLASILQCLFDLPAFQERYNKADEQWTQASKPADDLETQLIKIANGLLSGRYSKPDPAAKPENQDDPVYQRGIAPAMLKHLVGRGHEEFSTMRQQDAFELLQHLFTKITKSSKDSGQPDPTEKFRFTIEQRLQCTSCKKVRYSITEQDSIFIDIPKDKIEAPESAAGCGVGVGGGCGDKEPPKDTYRAVTLKECLDRFTGQESVELTCAACGSKDGFTKQQLFKTFPDVLTVNASKMTVINWVPVKVDVPVIVPTESFLLDEYQSKGLQPGEEELPEDAEPAEQGFVPNEGAKEALLAMGMPENRCLRALHATGNSDPEAAMNWLFEHMEDADIDEPLPASAGKGKKEDVASAEKIQTLMEVGFGAPQARQALRGKGGNVEMAVMWLFENPDAQGVEEGSEETEGDGTKGTETKVVGSAELPAKFQLQSLVCHKGTSIHTGHYVAFVRKIVEGKKAWVLFNDEKVVRAVDVDEMAKFAYVYFFKRV